jgi:putative mRNA 3-end processing factor
MSELVVQRPEGLYCPAGDFFIDPWRPVGRAVITHAHSDHARTGHASYLCAAPGESLLRSRLGDIALQAAAYGERIRCKDAWVSLHPAGHVLGSAQVRVEVAGDVCVVSGDYKLQDDPTCAAFEPVRCRTFISESTFGLPIYRWLPTKALMAEVNAWWQENAAHGRTSLLLCYALGKAQRLLAGLDAAIGPILTHGAMASLNDAYRASGVALQATRPATAVTDKSELARGVVLAPPSAAGSPWARRFVDPSPAFASGWMQVRGARRQRRVERGFPLSDHADWPGLIAAITATGAERVLITHGRGDVLVRYLNELGIAARALNLDYGEEDADTASASVPAPAAP